MLIPSVWRKWSGGGYHHAWRRPVNDLNVSGHLISHCHCILITEYLLCVSFIVVESYNGAKALPNCIKFWFHIWQQWRWQKWETTWSINLDHVVSDLSSYLKTGPKYIFYIEFQINVSGSSWGQSQGSCDRSTTSKCSVTLIVPKGASYFCMSTPSGPGVLNITSDIAGYMHAKLAMQLWNNNHFVLYPPQWSPHLLSDCNRAIQIIAKATLNSSE